MIKIYCILENTGDGYNNIVWLKEKPNLDVLWEKDPERWSAAEDYTEYTFPDYLNLERCGFVFTTLEEYDAS